MAKIIVSVIFLALAWPATAGEPPAMIEALNSVPNPTFASGNVEKTSAQGEGLLTLESVPAGAEIYLDGNLIATTPAVKVSISAGRHVVLLRKRGFQDWRREVSVLAGNTLTLRADLEAAGNEHR